MSKDKKEDRDMETPVVAQPRSFLEVLGIKVNKAEDFIINPILAAALDDIKKETDKAHANMTSQEIFQDLISPTTEDNDDE